MPEHKKAPYEKSVYNIFVGGIHIESSTFTPYRSGEKDFHITRGEELLRRYPKIDRVQLIPIMHARALPGGIVKRSFYEKFIKEFLEILKSKLKQQRIDGFFLDIHGAMSIEGSMDAEGDLIKTVRDIIGCGVPISVSMDLHGNVSKRLFDLSAVLTCCRTAPHTDVFETRGRAIRSLVSVLDNKAQGKKLTKAMVPIPILLPGEKTSTEKDPAKDLYNKIPELLKKDGMLDLSIWMGFPWADQPRSRAAVCAYGFDKQNTVSCAKSLAEAFWNYKDDFKFVGPAATLKEGLKIASESSKRPYFLSDTGDNPGAGGDNDSVIVLKEILNSGLEKQKKIALLSIKDEECVNDLKNKAIGEQAQVKIGGKISKSLCGPVSAKMRIANRYFDPVAKESVVLKKDNLTLVVTSNRYQFATEAAFKNAGLGNFSDYDIVVVKMGYLEPDLSRAAKGWTMLLTRGSVNQDLKSLDYKHLSRPLYPFDDNFAPNLSADIQQA